MGVIVQEELLTWQASHPAQALRFVIPFVGTVHNSVCMSYVDTFSLKALSATQGCG